MSSVLHCIISCRFRSRFDCDCILSYLTLVNILLFQGCLPVSHSEEQLFSYVNASLSLANELNIRSIDLWKGMLEQKVGPFTFLFHRNFPR